MGNILLILIFGSFLQIIKKWLWQDGQTQISLDGSIWDKENHWAHGLIDEDDMAYQNGNYDYFELSW